MIMSLEACNAVLAHSRSTGSTRLVLMCLAHHSNREKWHRSWPCIERIERETKLSRRQVQRHLRKAECELKELRVYYQAGQSQQNEYELLLPGLPGGVSHDTPEKRVGGDMEGDGGMTSKVQGGGADDTQTETGSEKRISKDPLNPPKGEERESDVEFWIEGIASLFHQRASSIPERLVRLLRKNGVPPREEFTVLKRYMNAGEPDKWDREEEAMLLKCRKQRAATLIRHFEEAMAKARRYSHVRPPTPRQARPDIPSEPDWDWRAFLIDRYCDPEPVNPPGKVITERDREEALQSADELRARITKWPWAGIADYLMREVGEEGQRRRAAAAKEDTA